MTYSEWETDDIIKELELYEKHYKEFHNFKIKEILARLREELRKRNID